MYYKVDKSYDYTVVYMPHCPRRLYHNVLVQNWQDLPSLCIIGNSFSEYRIKSKLSFSEKAGSSAINVMVDNELVCESSLPKCDKYDTAFNDMCFHSFKKIKEDDKKWELLKPELLFTQDSCL